MKAAISLDAGSTDDREVLCGCGLWCIDSLHVDWVCQVPLHILLFVEGLL